MGGSACRSLTSIEQRDETAFAKLHQAMSEVDFPGISGRLRFYKDSGVRVYSYATFDQDLVPGRVPGTVEFEALEEEVNKNRRFK